MRIETEIGRVDLPLLGEAKIRRGTDARFAREAQDAHQHEANLRSRRMNEVVLEHRANYGAMGRQAVNASAKLWLLTIAKPEPWCSP